MSESELGYGPMKVMETMLSVAVIVTFHRTCPPITVWPLLVVMVTVTAVVMVMVMVMVMMVMMMMMMMMMMMVVIMMLMIDGDENDGGNIKFKCACLLSEQPETSDPPQETAENQERCQLGTFLLQVSQSFPPEPRTTVGSKTVEPAGEFERDHLELVRTLNFPFCRFNQDHSTPNLIWNYKVRFGVV